MQSLKIILLSTSLLWLTACIGSSAQFFGDQVEYLKDDSGYPIAECPTKTDKTTGQPIFYSLAKSSANQYWKEKNLPEGTLYYICEGNRALLPKDCQGNSLTTPQIRRYWKKYDLPVGTTEFDCSSGVPKVAQGS